MSTDLSGSQYAVRRKELLALINQLRAAGAQSVIDLPRITVIGNQSAGKSSVVEAISGITVPRDSGTCTRSPFEVRMAHSRQKWSCKIAIRREYDPATNKPLPDIFEKPFGTTIYRKSQVELALRRAQLSALNPNIPETKILEADEEQLSEWNRQSVEQGLLFTRDVVCVELEGQELTDLAFIDLPGLIQNAEDVVVKLVEDIVLSHIKGNCIILVAIPMTDDIENQKALRLARQVDYDGKRTIGVMTKPDMLNTGSTKALSQWLDVIEGRRHPLVHGYYCTRQMNDAERSNAADVLETSESDEDDDTDGSASNSSKTTARPPTPKPRLTARQVEQQFFANAKPWSTSTSPERFGTPNLVNILGTLLVGSIERLLPTLTAQTSDQLVRCRDQLNALPPVVDEDPATHMLNLITAFASEISGYVRGYDAGNGIISLPIGPSSSRSSTSWFTNGARATKDPNRLLQANRLAYAELKYAIRKTYPKFLPWVQNQLRNVNGLSAERAEGGFNLTHMRHHVESSITRELPYNVPFPAKLTLIQSFQTEWPEEVRECLDQVQKVLREVVVDSVNRKFGRWEGLKRRVGTHVTTLMQTHYNSCHSVLENLLQTEHSPFTLNTHYLETSTEKWLGNYKEARVRKDATLLNDFEGRSHASLRDPSSNSGMSRSSDDVEEREEKRRKVNGFGSAAKPVYDVDKEEWNNSTPPSFKFGQPASSSANAVGGFDAGSNPFSFKPAEPTKATSLPPSRQTPQPASKAPPADPGEGETSSASEKEELMNDALAALAKIGYQGLWPEDLQKLNPVDEYEGELKVMAEVRGYFQVAFKKMIDMVPSFIDLLFIKGFSGALQQHLISEFGLGTAQAAERCKGYLIEDIQVVRKREDLVAMKRRLETIQNELLSFGQQ